ncbi:MAG TPA: hypothetical protein VGH27_19465 [Streptosporangiaceae bacterium]|jgi:hypothetical protein
MAAVSGEVGRAHIWSRATSAWVSCPPDEITWLDRELMSGNQDLTLHRSPRCAGLRYVHRQWELFSRDTTYPVYLAPHTGWTEPGQTVPDHHAVQLAAERVLPVAPAERYETLPVVLADGAWLISVGPWVLPLRLEHAAAAGPHAQPDAEQPPTQSARVRGNGNAARTREDAAERVRGYFERNAVARLAMAYYYQEFILGVAAPQPVPMADVVVALDLSGEGTISDYKKMLQGFIWAERGHPRELADFLLSNGLLTHADLAEARQAALANERSGKSELARERLAYRAKKRIKRTEPGS